jgi:GNAT superfamily N-acetyltransferase
MAPVPAQQEVVIHLYGDDLTFRPVDAATWHDLDSLFASAESDAVGNPAACRCMEWRLPRRLWEAQVGAANRAALRALAESGPAPGILAYRNGGAIGWCSVAPRPTLAGLRQASTLIDFDDPGVWSIVCFYVSRQYRGGGVAARLLDAAVEHAARNGARVVEAYPVDPTVPGALEQTGFMGVISAFRRAGFMEVPAAAGVLSLGSYTDGNRVMRRQLAGRSGLR